MLSIFPWKFSIAQTRERPRQWRCVLSTRKSLSSFNRLPATPGSSNCIICCCLPATCGQLPRSSEAASCSIRIFQSLARTNSLFTTASGRVVANLRAFSIARPRRPTWPQLGGELPSVALARFPSLARDRFFCRIISPQSNGPK